MKKKEEIYISHVLFPWETFAEQAEREQRERENGGARWTDEFRKEIRENILRYANTENAAIRNSSLNEVYTDGSYNSSGSSAAFRMNTSRTNSGGWEDSYMRNNICGTSKSTTSGRIMGAIPAELRNALKSVTKYTNNNGSSSASSAVTTTTDYFFLLSEYEVFGNITYSNTYEANYQQQYAYYSAGNSKVKYQHNSTGSAAYWWLRSPRAGYSYFFVFVNTDGTVNDYSAHTSLGFAPGFCV